jgi:hypothetical protein
MSGRSVSRSSLHFVRVALDTQTANLGTPNSTARSAKRLVCFASGVIEDRRNGVRGNISENSPELANVRLFRFVLISVRT